MRLKLVLIASLLAAIIGAGSSIAIVYWTIGPAGFIDPQFSRRSHGGMEIVMLMPPVLLALLACFFVYRHTARRRKLQAALTVILTLALSLAVHIAALFLLYR
jgi:glucan phosphoethanolaminetransferase (alkaline phosphatase superfamily)